jgi:hypothetical protein
VIIVALDAARGVLADGDLTLKDACLVVERALNLHRLAAALVGDGSHEAYSHEIVYIFKVRVVGLVRAVEEVLILLEEFVAFEVVVAEVEVIFVPPVEPVCPVLFFVSVFIALVRWGSLRLYDEVALDACALACSGVFIAGAYRKAVGVAGLCQFEVGALPLCACPDIDNRLIGAGVFPADDCACMSLTCGVLEQLNPHARSVRAL